MRGRLSRMRSLMRRSMIDMVEGNTPDIDKHMSNILAKEKETSKRKAKKRNVKKRNVSG